jgi:hypothetical protein
MADPRDFLHYPLLGVFRLKIDMVLTHRVPEIEKVNFFHRGSP